MPFGHARSCAVTPAFFKPGHPMAKFPFFARLAEKMIDNGYDSVVPVLPGQKNPRYNGWTAGCYKPTNLRFLENHVRQFPSDSIALPCGRLTIGIDIDSDDAAMSHALQTLAFEELGETPLIRIGRWPHRMLVYRPSGV
ncbi:MAG TPA: bifunctional DNA primase/polymerase, partial [Lacipirellulaceae bacterium]